MAEINKNNSILTSEDISKLMQSPVDKRLEITKKVAAYYTSGGFDKSQMVVAEQVFRTILKDTEVEVRKALSEAIKNSDTIPRDVVIELAKDVNAVSIPLLEFSHALTDPDLVDIINSSEDMAKHEGISRRENVSEKVSDSLISTGNEKVVSSLLRNKTAQVSEKGYTKIINDFSEAENIVNSVVERDKLPVTVVERLAKTVSDEIYKKLSELHKDSVANIDEVVRTSRETATMKVMGMKSSEQEYRSFCDLMKKLHIADELQPISALCVGNLNLFEICMARATKVPVLNVRTLIEDQSNKGFNALYERAHLPENLHQATEVLLDVLRELKDDLEDSGIKLSGKTANRMIEHLMMKAEEKGHIENFDYIITLIKHNAAMAQQNKGGSSVVNG